MNGRYVRENPSYSFHSRWFAARTRSTRSKSTRTDVYTCALVAFDRTMCSAVRRRMLSNGTTVSPADAATGAGAPPGAAAGGAVGADGALGALGALGAAGAPRPARWRVAGSASVPAG